MSELSMRLNEDGIPYPERIRIRPEPGVRLPRPAMTSTSVGHQLWLHRHGWTPLDTDVSVVVSNDLDDLWQATRLAMGWSPPDPGPAERAFLLTERGLKAVRPRTQRKIAAGKDDGQVQS